MIFMAQMLSEARRNHKPAFAAIVAQAKAALA